MGRRIIPQPLIKMTDRRDGIGKEPFLHTFQPIFAGGRLVWMGGERYNQSCIGISSINDQ